VRIVLPLLARFARLVAVALIAVPPTEAGDLYSGRQQETTVHPPRLEAGATIDGILDEPAWEQAARLVDFSQYAPVDGRPAANDTEVLVWYSPTAIYFGVRANAEVGTVRATLADRDRIDNDDQIHIFLSTFNDGRQALVFGVNPLGVQLDGALVEGAGASTGGEFSGLAIGREATDLSPDFVFDSRGRTTAAGYEVEIRIPFKTLRYPATDPQVWGVNVLRFSQQTGHEDSWVPARRSSASFLAQSGTLSGLTDLRRGLVLDLNPVVTAHTTGQAGVDGWRYDPDSPEFGGNVRWGVTSNLTLNGTINPDFSQVEADAGEFVYDPRSAVFFPEKRPFFLEGSEFFATPNELIYTRRIVAPVAAAKLTGKVAGTSLGLLSAIDDRAQSLSGDDHPLFTIGRVQRDVGAASKLALVFTDRTEDLRSNRVGSADARLVLREMYSLQLQGAVSRTRLEEATTTAPLWQAIFARNGRRYSLRCTSRGVDDEFSTASGFVSRTGIVRNAVTNQIAFYGPPGGWWERLSGDVVLDGTWQYDDFVGGRSAQDRKLHINLNGALRGGWQATASVLIESFGYDSELYEDYAILLPGPEGDRLVPFTGTPRLGNLDYVVSLTMPPRRGLSLYAFALWGRDENFHEWSPADIAFAEVTAQWRPQTQLRVDASWKLQSYSRRSDGSSVAWRRIPRLRLEYQLTRAIFLRGVVEYDANWQDDLRDDSRTNAPIFIRDPDTGDYERALGFERNQLRADWLFSYQPVPGTVFFAGYTSILTEPLPDGRQHLGRAADGFFLKFSYLWRL
jgi:hypothetical protein